MFINPITHNRYLNLSHRPLSDPRGLPIISIHGGEGGIRSQITKYNFRTMCSILLSVRDPGSPYVAPSIRNGLRLSNPTPFPRKNKMFIYSPNI
ncbi:MAG: hypothetical protein BMS9Abin13_225 [Patescibacteria group bacterium]|nr:MAG: hypothetical protein BMS9Abin13_225 [Patescibacteria group bacterium]